MARKKPEMTRAEWAASEDPGAMLRHLGARVTPRKRRLFAVACCRRMQFVADDAAVSPERAGHYRHAVMIAERFADRQATRDDLADAVEKADDSAFINSGLGYEELGHAIDPFREVASSKQSEVAVIWRDLLLIAGSYGTDRTAAGRRRRERREIGRPRPDDEASERTAQVGLIRCVFGDPFRPGPFPSLPSGPMYLDSSYVDLAWEIYEGRDFGRLPELGKMLEPTGLGEEDVLEHCRSGGEHARGCWVVDGLLGRR